ncbi:hypothetical protein [Caballeronia sp. ATUFL_M2_KS44]|uniref:hypothetical protein n=1 Tax=Caballeronia sp. ATUFL_M2_KS44 TaxID=2921767 RepID=UPI002027F9BF|nr:hypothetical protein [Caballeronia sp. ATUFL_M2_KS44]
MPARYAMRLMTISVVLMTIAGPSFAKYAEEWMGSANVAPAQAAAQSRVHAAASRADTSTRHRTKSMSDSSPFTLDPIAAYADDPIAAFARPRTKSALR